MPCSHAGRFYALPRNELCFRDRSAAQRRLPPDMPPHGGYKKSAAAGKPAAARWIGYTVNI